MKKIKFIGIGFIVLAIIITGIIVLSGFRIDDFLQKGIYNNDKAIIKKSDFYYGKNFSKDFQNENLSMNFNNISGRKTICDVDAVEEGKVSINYESNIEKGKVKIVYVSEQNKIQKILEEKPKGYCDLEVLKGKGYIKIIADEATGRIKLDFKTGKDDIIISNHDYE